MFINVIPCTIFCYIEHVMYRVYSYWCNGMLLEMLFWPTAQYLPRWSRDFGRLEISPSIINNSPRWGVTRCDSLHQRFWNSWYKISALILMRAIQSHHKFAHAMTPLLSRNVQICDMIGWLFYKSEGHIFCQVLDQELINDSWKQSQVGLMNHAVIVLFVPPQLFHSGLFPLHFLRLWKVPMQLLVSWRCRRT